MKLSAVVVIALVSSTAAAAPKPVARPAAVLAVASLSAPDGHGDSLGGLRAFSAAALPKSASFDLGSTIVLSLEQIAGAPADAIAPTGPVYAIAVDDGTASGIVIVGRTGKPSIADGGALTRKRDGWSVIGPKLAVTAVADYAFALATRPPAPGLTATIYAPAVLARFKDDLDELRGTLSHSNDGASDMVGELLAIAPDLDELRVTATGDASRLAIELTADVRAGTPLAGFVAAQRASDFGVLGSLAESGPLLVAGTMTLGAQAAGWRQVLFPELAYLQTSLAPAFDAISRAATGDFAMTRDLGGATAMYAFGMTEPKAAEAGFAALVAALGKGVVANVGGAAQIRFKPGPGTTIDGVVVRDILGAIAGAEPLRYDLAIVDAAPALGKERLALVSFGSHAVDQLKPVVAIAHGKPAPLAAPAIAQLVAGARQRGDSVVVAFDPATMMKGPATAATPISASIGFAHGIRVRIELPATALRAIVSQ